MSYPRLFAFLANYLLAAIASFAQGFNPSDYGTVTLHLKADALTLTNNAPVVSWGPLSGAGTSQPLFIAADARFNNKPVVKFDGVNDVLTWASANLSARTIFAVTTLESGATSLAGLISNGADGLNVRRDGTSLFYRSPGHGMDANDFVGNGSPTGTLSVNNVAGGAYTAGTPHLVIAVAGGLKNYSSFWIGSASSSLGRYLNGSVGEVLIYDGVLSQTGIDRVGYYLQTKYNLPTNFPAPTPTIESFSATTGSGISSQTGVLSTSGAVVTLSWDVFNSTSVSIDQGVLASSPNATGTINVAPTNTTTYTLTATNAVGSVNRQVTVHIGATPQPPRINEFLADNEDGITDVDGAHSDWIEIYNPNPFAIDLQGYGLRNGPTQPNANQWNFPAGSAIDANGYRIIFASQKNLTNPASELHTDFSLDNAGEYLALVRLSDSAILTEFAPFPPQYADASYGYWGTPLKLGYFGKPGGAPTPGAANSVTGVTGFLDQTDDTKFTIGRGFYTAAVTTTITASTPGAKIIYTTNGTEPSETNGTQVLPANASTPPSVTLTIHPGAVPGGSTGVNIPSVGGVTMLRAAAFLAGYAPTNVDTQTYLFPAQVLGQTVTDAYNRGWPSTAINGQLFNYGMDPNVVSSFSQAQMFQSLQSIPTLSIVTPIGNLVDPLTGIYVNADQHGSAWERPVSMEMIMPPGYVDPDGNAAGFQINAGLRIRGGFSRNDQFFKHGFRVFFSGKYDGKLNYPLFGSEGTTEFGKVDLGTGSNYGWQREGDYNVGKFNTLCRDPFARLTQGALGQPNTKSRYYHLYLNGHYWGLYYTEERAEAEFGASYMGGNQDEYDAVKCANHIGNFVTEATDGTLTAWQTLWNKTRAIGSGAPTNANYFGIQGRNADGTRNPALPVLLDVDNLIDEMLVLFYMGDGDAVLSSFLGNHDRPNNWFSLYRRTGDLGFRFFIRDAEHTLGTTNWTADQTGPWTGANVYNITYANPQSMHQDLVASPLYRLRFADHVQRHFFNNGALTPAQCTARFLSLANRVELAIKSESARWGDAQSLSNLPGGHPPRYILSDWIAARDYVTNTIMPTRTATVLAQLRTDGLFPNLAAPVYANDADGQTQHGGDVAMGFQLRITAPNGGTIYYTLDGTDPRAVSGTAAGQTYSTPLTINATTFVSARVLNGSTWSALTTALFRVNTVPASAANFVVSQIDYNPVGGNVNEFIELMNISVQNLDLTGVHLRDAVDYDFPANAILPPGGRIQVVGDLDAFNTRFGGAPPLRIVGPYLGNLSNGGERILVTSDTQGDIRDFSYDNNVPWPPETDGLGYRLVLIAPQTNPDHTNPYNWRGSLTQNHTPAASDAVPFSGNATADIDQDGLNAFLEYSLATSDTTNTTGPNAISHATQTFTVNGVSASYLTLAIVRAPATDDAIPKVE
ncbi:MAG TPA: lamin tail domain-containing protein, partial [Chthoniobacteraceae bacterium]|nr:lamin tail domain-containing protein [Chthoniobacteraceae bacterium]